ncbi:MAG: hypothetical protein B7733_21960 [Myxococcales bacterium FL481]|nr:MAG: hypothetical protein B7733_21960 [Myxococcales bacterium FL481]
MKVPGSSRVVLAQLDVCTVELCACDTIHLSVGPASIRLYPQVAHVLLHTLSRALEQAHARFGHLDPEQSAAVFAQAANSGEAVH